MRKPCKFIPVVSAEIVERHVKFNNVGAEEDKVTNRQGATHDISTA